MEKKDKPHYRLGTARMLELAKDDVRKVPWNTIFRLGYSSWLLKDKGKWVLRAAGYSMDDESSAGFVSPYGVTFCGKSEYEVVYLEVDELEPIL